MNPNNLLTGDVASIIQIHHGRGKGSADRPICACRASTLNNTDVSQGDIESLAIIDLAQKKKEPGHLALGLRPGVPMFVPEGKCSTIGLPEPLTVTDHNVYEDMTKEAFNNYKGTFLRKTLHISDVQYHSYGGDAGFFKPINPQDDFTTLGGSLKTYPGWSVLTFKSPQAGLEYSGWMFLIDGNFVYCFIKHEDINGNPLTLWKPWEIYEQVIEPRINKGLPITKYGLSLESDGAGGFSVTYTKTGTIYKSTYIDVSQFMVLIDPSWMTGTAWENAFDGLGDPVYDEWPLLFTELGFDDLINTPFCAKLYPTSGYVLPVMTLILAKNLVNLTEAQTLLQLLGIYGSNYKLKDPIGFNDIFAWIDNLLTLQEIFFPA